jgi:hypothetical protein
MKTTSRLLKHALGAAMVLSVTVSYLSIASANAQELTDDERQQLTQEGAADGKNTALKDVQPLKTFR